MYVEDDKGDKVYIPDYIALSFKRYRYDKEDKMLQKQCVTCSRWFNALHLQGNTLIDVHCESEFHLRTGSSGYEIRCNSCTEKYKISTKKIAEPKNIKNNTNAKEKNDKYSLYLKPSNKKFLDFIAALNGITIADVLNQIIEKELNSTDIDKLINDIKKIYKK
jgi:hypothetical protein